LIQAHPLTLPSFHRRRGIRCPRHQLKAIEAFTPARRSFATPAVELVAKGLSTNDIGQRLHLSAYTVQEHIKSIFDKTGTGSRGELIARLFFDHYAPRLLNAEPD
jgi:DNA-binding NarL/FixJ family response regulator